MMIFFAWQSTMQAEESEPKFSHRDQEIIENLELLEVLELLEEEDQEFLLHYDSMNEVEDDSLSVQKDDEQNE